MTIPHPTTKATATAPSNPNPFATNRKDWRHYAATSYCVRVNPKSGAAETLLLFHKKLNVWLPPGGHVDENETPQDAALREFEEETGLKIELVDGVDGFHKDFREDRDAHAKTLPRPRWFNLESIRAATTENPPHEHLDFIFLARLLPENKQDGQAMDLHDSAKWFNAADVQNLQDEKEIYLNTKTFALEALNLFLVK